jgi:5'(3')-deoxyribonucleotidase
MDDVLVDTTGAIMRHMGLSDYESWRDYPDGIGRDIVTAYQVATGIRYEDAVFWEHFKREFWAGMPATPWCNELVNFAEDIVGRDNVYICTSPTKCGDCLAGKLDWIAANLPYWMHRQYIMTPRKEACAITGSILIDDADCNVKVFIEAGGVAVAMPAPWNVNRAFSSQPMNFLEEWFDNWDSYGTI